MPVKTTEKLEIYRQGKPLYAGDLVPFDFRLPSVVLHYAKYPHNVGQAIRILSCYGLDNLWVSGNRMDLQPHEGYRLPREERMKGYGGVTLASYHDPLAAIMGMQTNATPVAVELVPGAEDLAWFDHPENPIYVFGPEDGGLPGSVLKQCHRFVKMSTVHCLNLATAVGTVLYDRSLKITRSM